MSGILKGDSIYKSGGGGGYKDGGQLVDGDFIKVENNTISSYDNVSRDPVNFYFEVKDGEVLNSVVELTTAVNATINVYVVRNGFYYLLGNVGGNTVNAGDDYKVNITGDSYSVEQVTTTGNDPEFIDISGKPVKVVKIGNLFWTELLFLEGFTHNVFRSNYYYPCTLYEQVNNFLNNNNCRLPTKNDWDYLISYIGGSSNTYKIRSTSGWDDGGGTNELGMNVQALGYVNVNTDNYYGSRAYFMGNNYKFSLTKNSMSASQTFNANEKVNIRAVFDA